MVEVEWNNVGWNFWNVVGCVVQIGINVKIMFKFYVFFRMEGIKINVMFLFFIVLFCM